MLTSRPCGLSGMINPKRLERLVASVAILAQDIREGRITGPLPGIQAEILAGNPERIPDVQAVGDAFKFYLSERDPNDDPDRMRLCLNCGSVLIVLMAEQDGCPACGDRSHSQADLNDTVAPELTAYELRVLCTYAENYARMSSVPAMRVMKTILTRLTAQGLPDTMSPQLRELESPIGRSEE